MSYRRNGRSKDDGWKSEKEWKKQGISRCGTERSFGFDFSKPDACKKDGLSLPLLLDMDFLMNGINNTTSSST
jgi:hypothetical protein